MAFNLKGIIKGILIKNDVDQTKKLEISVDPSATTATKTTISAKQTANRNLDLPDVSGVLVEKDATQTLTNKTIDGDNNTVQDLALTSLKTDAGNPNKFLQRDGSGVVVHNKAVPTGEVVGTTDTQTLTGKTIDGDDNTVQDLSLSSLKTVLADANKVITRDVTGAVVSSSSIPEATIPSGIDATKIANGTVDNTEFQYLNGVTSSIQTQLGNKISSSEKGAALGVATLDAGSKIPSAQIPAIALTDVYVVADIAARDALTVQEGDVAKVLNDGSGNVVTYIYDGSLWVEMTTNDDVNAHSATTTGIHGVTGNVVGTSDSQTLTNKTIDGDNNTIQDLALSSLKTDAPNANKFLQRDGSGIVVASKSVPTGNVVGTSDTQTLTNKKFDGGTASASNQILLPKNTLNNLQGIARQEASLMFASDTDTVYIDNGTSLIPVGSGGGTGGINYITAWNAEDSTGGLTGWSDVAGTGLGSWVLSVQSGTVLRGSKSFKITKTGDCTGKYSYIIFTIDPQDKNKQIYWSMDVATDGSYVVDDVGFDLESNTAVDFSGTTTSISVRGSVVNGRATFSFPTNNDLYYRIRIKANNSNSNNFNFYFDTVIVGPDKLVDGLIDTDLGSLTTTGGFTNATYSGKYSRKRNILKAIVEIAITGIPVGTLSINLPAGMTIDTSKIPSGVPTITPLGSAFIYDVSAAANANLKNGRVSYNTTTSVLVTYYSPTNDDYASVVPAAPIPFASGDYVTVQFEVPILEWANQSAVLSTTEMMNQISSVTATLSANQTGINTNNSYVKVALNTLNSGISTYFDSVNNRIIAKRKTKALLFGSIFITGANILNSRYTAVIRKNGSDYIFGDSITPTATQNTAVSCSGYAECNVNDYFELFIYGFGNNSVNTYSISNSYPGTSLQFIEQPDLSVYSTYGNTELIESKNGTLTAIGTAIPGYVAGQYGDLTSIQLSPGEWDITATISYASIGGATTTTDIFCGIATTSGNSFGGLVYTDAGCFEVKTTTQNRIDTCVIPRYTAVVTTPTTYYLKALAGSSITNLQVAYKISARRIK